MPYILEKRGKACLPDGRDEFDRLSTARGEIQEVGWEYGRLAFPARVKNLLKECAGRK